MFKVVDLADLRERLNPVTLGYDAGQRGSPPTDAGHDPNEQQIVEAIEDRIRDAHAALMDQRKEAEQHLAETRTGAPTGDVHAAVKDAESRFNQVAQTTRPELEDLRLETEKRRTELSKFRREHELTNREPDYPDSGRRWLMVGILMILFFLESFANAAFLAKGNELGLVGAYVVAFGISLLNIGSSFLIFGPVSRYLAHISVWQRVLAGICMVVYAGLAFALNLGVAHYREVSGDLIGDAGVAVVRRVLESPLGLQDAESWLLLGIGLLFSLVAFIEGRTFDDTYPGYGRRDRSVRAAFENHLATMDSVSQELDEIRERALDNVKRIAHDVRRQPEELRRIVEDCRRRLAEFDNHADHLQKVGETLISEYREANRTARPDGVVPAAHRTPWRLTLPRIDRSLPTLPGTDPASVEGIDRDYRLATDRIHERCEAVRSRLLHATEPSGESGVRVAPEPGPSSETSRPLAG